MGVPDIDQCSQSARAVTCQRCQGEGYEFRFTELVRRCPECNGSGEVYPIVITRISFPESNLPPESLERIKQGVEDMEAGRMRPLRDIIAERGQ